MVVRSQFYYTQNDYNIITHTTHLGERRALKKTSITFTSYSLNDDIAVPVPFYNNNTNMIIKLLAQLSTTIPSNKRALKN